MTNFPLHSAPSEHLPTLAEMERYVQGRMDEGEKVQFEAQLAEDPFLADAVEGLQETTDRRSLKQRLHYLRKQSQERVLLRSRHQVIREKRGSRIKPLWWPQAVVGLAAVLALLVLVFVRDPQPQSQKIQYTENTQPAEAMNPIPPMVPEQAPPNEEEAGPIPEETTAIDSHDEGPSVAFSQEAPSESLPEMPSLPPYTYSDYERAMSGDEDAPIAEESPLIAETSSSFEPVVDTAYGGSVAYSTPATASLLDDDLSPSEEPSTIRESRAASTIRAKREDRDSFEDAIVADDRMQQESEYISIHLMAASDKITEGSGVSSSPTSAAAEATFNLGTSAYQQGDMQRAIAHLTQISDTTASFYDQAQWLLAQAYHARQQTAQAIKTLRPLTARPGQYQHAAQYLLASWAQSSPTDYLRESEVEMDKRR